MRTKNFFRGCRVMILAMIASILVGIAAPSCGTIRTYGGIEHEYEYDFDGNGHYKKHKHKKHKPKKHKKPHHRHHHHDD